MTDSVRRSVQDQVLVITLDRPPANAIDVGISRELYDAFRALEEDASLRVGVLTAAGSRYFSAGWDLKAAASGEAVDADHGPGGFAGLTEYFERTKPIVAAVNGLALGGGCELALAADLVVLADHAELGLPEVRLGLVADSGGLVRVPALLPDRIARELLLTGRRIGADEAARWGLANRVVPPGELMTAALELAGQIAQAAPLAVAAVLEVLGATRGLSLEEAFAVQRSGRLPQYRAMLGSQDAVEGPQAFAEKRPPVWRGR